MKIVFKRMVSLILTFIMIVNFLPLHIFAEEVNNGSGTGQATSEAEGTLTRIVEEIPDKRSEYSKEFKLNNGLHMAAVYPEAVHFETEEGQWEDIDNTLILTGSGTNAAYTNTAGVWEVSFPQSMSSTKRVSISKDDYTLAFGMAGQLRRDPNAEIMSEGTATASVDATGGTAETLAVNPAGVATAQLQTVDMSAMIAGMEYPEIVSDKLNSRLAYNDLFSGTDVVYDLCSNKVKESIVMGSYDENLRGFRYTLDVGTMIPVLGEDGHIDLYDANQEEIVMVMPAPYMVDDAGEVSHDVTVTLVPNGTAYTLNYLMPLDWLADTDRSWPVILDPVVVAESDADNILDHFVTEDTAFSYTAGSLWVGFNDYHGVMRTFIQYVDLPALTSSDVIVDAQLSLVRFDGRSLTTTIEAHKVLEDWDSQTITWANQPDHDPIVEDYAMVSSSNRYYWNITDVVREWYSDANTGVMLKATDTIEEARSSNWQKFYSIDYSQYDSANWPYLTISFRNNNGLESYWDYTASSAGRAGTGYINNYTGNLVWVRSDIGFGGNRMPVSISHIYNANDSKKNEFGLGYGWRTNFNQLVYQWDQDDQYYVWEDGDGTKHYFRYSTTNTYEDEDGLELTLTTNGSGTTKYRITDKYDNTSYFDTNGRLTKMSNNQATQSHITITYTSSTSKQISKITDGAGRVYDFTYTSSLLSKISYKGTDTEEDAYVNFGYTSSKLTTVTDTDGKKSTFAYTTNNLLSSATDVDGYKLTYTYTQTTAGKPSRVKTVKETSGSATGGELTIEYAHNQTTFTDHNGNVQIAQFNNWGNTVSIQDGEGRAQFAQYANNTASDTDTGKGNQLKLASKLQNTVGNIAYDNGFELGTTWTAINSSVSSSVSTAYAYRGNKSLSISRSAAGAASGVSAPFTAAAYSTYTFSAYVKTGSGSSLYLALDDGSSTVTSETLPENSDWTRLQVTYKNESGSSKKITAKFMTTTAGTSYIDCQQIEKAPTASRYNLADNGDFRYTTGWSSSSGRTTMAAAAPELSGNVYKMVGSPTAKNRINQTVQVKGSKGDTFVLAGWAKGDSAPLPKAEEGENQRQFAVIGTFNYTDGTTGESIAQFNPDTDSTVNWQYSATAMVAEKAYNSIKLELAYDYNVNTVYFDGIQLYKEEFGNSYRYDDDGNVISVVDLQKKQTTYEYDTNNNLTGVFQDNKAKMTYEYYPGTHNVKTATTGEGLVYNFAYDTYGNNTSVSISSGGLTLQSTAEYENSGNTLKKTTDAAGKVTTYQYDADTNVLDWVKYPEDTEATRTEYTYDNMYRLASAEATTDQGSALTAQYTYSNDMLTAIKTASTTYTFAYGSFALRSNIKIGSRTLASYTYTSRNNYLDTLAYGNGDRVEYDYDDQGRVTKQTYEDGDTVTYAYDNSGALATVTDSATGRTATYYYDFTDRLMKYVEKGTGYTHSVGYEYDDINNLTALVDTINGVKYTTSYIYDDDNRVTSVTAGTASRTYGYDGFSRVNSRTTKHNGATLLTDTLTYRTPTSTTTSGQIATLRSQASGYDVTSTYTYDDNGNILSVSDGNHTSSYVYDTANQLIRENNQKLGKTWVWTYDDAGNILSRKEYAYTTGDLGTVLDTISYTYGNSDWGDLLTTYNGTSITHDNIGNPLNDGTWTYTWEHGRELMSMYGEDIGGEANDVTITYEYDADGMRTKKTVTTNHYSTPLHSYTAVVTAPTCTEGGYTTYTCECGDSYQGDFTEATGHSYTSVVTVPTCTEPGYTTYTCECGDSYQGDFTEATGHSYTSVIAAPTCTEIGYTTYTCSCGDSYQDNVTEALGHDLTETIVEPGEGSSDNVLYECTRCEYSNLGHSHVYTDTVVQPTCTEAGYTLHNCFCGYSYQDSATEPLGHTTTVLLGDNCERCGEHIHVYKYNLFISAPTCTEPGIGTKTCECGDSIQITVPATGHSFNQLGVCQKCGYKSPIGIGGEMSDYSLRQTNSEEGRTLISTVVQEYTYVYTGGSLMQMVVKTTTTPVDGSTTTTTETLNFTYDASGVPLAVDYNGTDYYYVANIQGDILTILDTSGTAVVEYTYDAWGKLYSTTGTLADTLGEANPLTYRGYVYDSDSHLYYLQSRYYDPSTGRFINADSYASTGQGILGCNMFAYCRNNPVSRKDASGTEDVSVEDFNQDNNPLNDLGNPTGSGGGGNIWGSFVRTLKQAADGLKMASGQRDLTHTENHHIISNKRQVEPIEYKEIADRYNYRLDHPSNIVSLPGHRGRHTDAYHDFMSIAIKELDVIAAGSTDAFIKGMEVLGRFILDNSWLPYAQHK